MTSSEEGNGGRHQVKSQRLSCHQDQLDPPIASRKAEEPAIFLRSLFHTQGLLIPYTSSQGRRQVSKATVISMVTWSFQSKEWQRVWDSPLL